MHSAPGCVSSRHGSAPHGKLHRMPGDFLRVLAPTCRTHRPLFSTTAVCPPHCHLTVPVSSTCKQGSAQAAIGNLPVQDADGVIAQIHSASILWSFWLLPMPPRVKQGEVGPVVAVACSNV